MTTKTELEIKIKSLEENPPVASKVWWKSLSVWANVLAAAVAVVGNFGYSGEVPAEYNEYVVVATIIINIIIRLTKTKTNLTK